jgi:hypothetical protein
LIRCAVLLVHDSSQGGNMSDNTKKILAGLLVGLLTVIAEMLRQLFISP